MNIKQAIRSANSRLRVPQDMQPVGLADCVVGFLVVSMAIFAAACFPNRKMELIAGCELLLACFLCVRSGLLTELACYILWAAAICCTYILRAVEHYSMDRAGWDSEWQDGVLLLAIIPMTASVIVFVLRCWLEPTIATRSK